MPRHRKAIMNSSRISVVCIVLWLVIAPCARAEDVGAPADIVRAIVEADVAGESMFRAMSKLQRLETEQKHEAADLLTEATKSSLDQE
jgi:hypothetical protein